MEDYYYIYKAENRSKSHGSSCDKLSFVDRFSFEKLHGWKDRWMFIPDYDKRGQMTLYPSVTVDIFRKLP
jgi:hypothetical protein